MRRTDRDYYIPDEIGSFLGVDAQMVRVSLRQNAPGWEDIPYYGDTRLRIPKKGFSEWWLKHTGEELTQTVDISQIKRKKRRRA